mgnify:CR=1 FL=1
MTTELTHWIDGQHVKGTSGRFADVYNPATGEVQAKCPLASDEEMHAAVMSAKAAQPAWAAVNPQRRARVLMAFVQLLHRDMDKLAEALSREHGKTIPDAKGDLIRGLEVIEFAVGHFGVSAIVLAKLTETLLGQTLSGIIPNYTISPETMGVGFGVAFAIGVFAGLLPAIQASRLNPVQALRKEV